MVYPPKESESGRQSEGIHIAEMRYGVKDCRDPHYPPIIRVRML